MIKKRYYKKLISKRYTYIQRYAIYNCHTNIFNTLLIIYTIFFKIS